MYHSLHLHPIVGNVLSGVSGAAPLHMEAKLTGNNLGKLIYLMFGAFITRLNYIRL